MHNRFSTLSFSAFPAALRAGYSARHTAPLFIIRRNAQFSDCTQEKTPPFFVLFS
jgi:hypothetical protein